MAWLGLILSSMKLPLKGTIHLLNLFSQNGCQRPFQIFSDQYTTFICLKYFHKMAYDSHFEYHKITFNQYAILFLKFNKMAAAGHFACIYHHFRSICNFFLNHKMAISSHIGYQKSLSIAFHCHIRSISNYLNLFFKILDVGNTPKS